MNVRHVLDLRKNLLSSEALEAQGCKFSSTYGGVKVTKSSMTILKGERAMNLYKMIGSIIVDDTLAATEKEDTT